MGLLQLESGPNSGRQRKLDRFEGKHQPSPPVHCLYILSTCFFKKLCSLSRFSVMCWLPALLGNGKVDDVTVPCLQPGNLESVFLFLAALIFPKFPPAYWVQREGFILISLVTNVSSSLQSKLKYNPHCKMLDTSCQHCPSTGQVALYLHINCFTFSVLWATYELINYSWPLQNMGVRAAEPPHSQKSVYRLQFPLNLTTNSLPLTGSLTDNINS